MSSGWIEVPLAWLCGVALMLVADLPKAGAGPIPCLDGSTVNIGEFCPVPTVNCADGTNVFIGQWCPVGPKPCAQGEVRTADGKCGLPAGEYPPPRNCRDGTSVPAAQECPR